MNRIYIVGYMGAGKTTAARRLAQRLGWEVADTDALFEEKYKISVCDFFNKYDEPLYRKLESEVLKSTENLDNVVISTGGGTVKNPANVEALKKSGVMVCLQANVDTVLERTQNRGTRPVLDKEDKGDRRQAVEKLLAERAELYKQADFAVDTSDLSPLQVVEIIVKTLKTRGALHA